MLLVSIALVLLCIVVAIGCWLGFLLLQQSGRLLLRLESVEERLKQLEMPSPAPTLAKAPPPVENGIGVGQRTPLPIGTPAPEWELPDLSGETASLCSFRGRRVLLIFFNPRCGFCTRMGPDLAALPVDGAQGLPVPVMITTGDAQENLRFVREHQLRFPVFLQEGMQVAHRYDVGGTPMGYLVNEEGAIASEVAVGSEAVLELARLMPQQNGVASPGGGPAGGRLRSVAESKINRDGLPAGTLAPDFRLPLLRGGELFLEDYRGQEVLLVFSDPHCGPCDQLLPMLEAAHRQSLELRILMVSRGDEAANHRKAAEHRLNFPIALQQKWEVSRLYQIFATPVGFLIGADGRTMADVAMGVEPILSLLSRARAPGNERSAGEPVGDLVR